MLAFQEPASIERFLVITSGRVDFDYSPQFQLRQGIVQKEEILARLEKL